MPLLFAPCYTHFEGGMVIGRCSERRVGSYAFKASSLLLASEIAYPRNEFISAISSSTEDKKIVI